MNPRALVFQSPWKTYTYADTLGWGDLLTQYNGQTITYDEIGNPLTYRDGMTMEWQNGRELLMCEYSSGYSTYKYGYNGLRTSKTILGPNNRITNVKYIYEGDKLLQMIYDDYVLTFSYDANGIPVSFHVKNATLDKDYYYGTNSRGDIEVIYNADGTLHARYDYDAYGKILSVTAPDGTNITAPYAIANLNPLRYRSYVYDNETGFYYLQSRYYDPVTCRFINADAYMSTGQGITGNNMFAYCNNNPISYSDPTGHCATHTYYYMPSCPGCNTELAALHAERGADWADASRDVTQEVNKKLLVAANIARLTRAGINSLHGLERTIVETGTLLYFKSQVQDGAPWDIKQPKSWVETIGTESPKYKSRFIYNGIEMNSADLGNYTYGYLGSAYGYSLDVLYGGSYVAAKFPTGGNQLKHEITQDWKYISMGYYDAESGNLLYFPPSIPTMN